MQKLLVILVMAALMAPAIAYDDKEILAFARGAAASSGLDLKTNISIYTGIEYGDVLEVHTNFGPILGTDTGLWMMTGDMLKVTKAYPGRFGGLEVVAVNNTGGILGTEWLALDSQGIPKSSS